MFLFDLSFFAIFRNVYFIKKKKKLRRSRKNSNLLFFILKLNVASIFILFVIAQIENELFVCFIFHKYIYIFFFQITQDSHKLKYITDSFFLFYTKFNKKKINIFSIIKINNFFYLFLISLSTRTHSLTKIQKNKYLFASLLEIQPFFIFYFINNFSSFNEVDAFSKEEISAHALYFY